MTSDRWFQLLFIFALLVGSILRLADLPSKTLHSDEAVQAYKFGTLLDTGKYVYDPHEYHGPSLYYFSLPIAKLRGQESYRDIDEWTLRLVPALFGILLLLSFLLFLPAFGWAGVGGGCLLAALSPPFVYFSRYYVQEMILVAATVALVGCLYRWFRSQKVGWMLLAGLCLALMHMSKETFVISCFAIVVAGLGVQVFQGRRGDQAQPNSSFFRCLIPPIKLSHLFVGATVAAGISMLFFSSFFSNPQGVLDSVLTYLNYLHRAEGSGHEKPFGYYASLLWFQKSQGFYWGEAIVLLLGSFGCVAGFLNPRLRAWAVFITLYATVAFLFYSAIPYKTPWILLNLEIPLLLGAGLLLASFRHVKRHGKQHCKQRLIPVSLLFIILACAQYPQNKRVNHTYAADQRNPYAYAHTTANYRELPDKIVELQKIDPALKVAMYGPNYWPLPWDLRAMTNLVYSPGIPEEVPEDHVLIVDSEYSEQLEKGMSEAYAVPSLSGLRSNVMLWVYIRSDIFEKFIESR